MEEIRLQKYMADCGIASRRKCEEYILEEKVKVNGKVINKLGIKVNPNKDKIEFLMISTSKEIPEELKSEISMKIYYDLNGECQEMYNATVIPTMVYIDGNNEVINAKSGVPSNDAIEANLDLISNNF